MKKSLLTTIGIIVAISTTITTGIVTTKCLQNKETEISKISEETANTKNTKIEKTTYAGKDTDNLLAENDVIGTWDASATEQDHVTATLYSDGRFVISGTGKMKDYSCSSDRPWDTKRKEIKTAEIQEGITSVGYDVFAYCSSLTNINIPEGVKSIGWEAFSECSNLISVNIPNSVIDIERWAFYRCSSLTSINIPNSVTSIGDIAFCGCSSLTSINIPEGVTRIGPETFDGCSNLTSIEIPSSVTTIGDGAFEGCSSLTSIEIPSSVTSIGGGAFSNCSNLTSINIPEGVTSIGTYAFEACSSLTAININENNKNYTSENGVLFNKYKTEIICYPAGKEEKEYIIPNSVTSIGNGAFDGCSNLISINIPNSVTSIGWNVFKDCDSLTSINIPEGVTSIGAYAFEACSSLTRINIPNSVTNIGDIAFSGCSSLKGINVDKNNKDYTSDNGILFNKDKTEIICYPAGKEEKEYIIPDIVTSIGYGAFKGCSSLISINIPNSVTSIGEIAFKGCSSLIRINIPNSVTSIGAYAFIHCSSLTNIEVPSSVTDIGLSAFYGCKHIEVVAIDEKTAGEVTIQLPELVKRSLDENDILYAKGKDPTLANCTISKEEGTMTFKVDDMIREDIKIRINDGALDGVTVVVVVVPSGRIFYSETKPTTKDVTATIFIAKGEEMINNNGSKEHVFTENGTFTFKYKDKEGKEKEATAKVDNILLKGDANGDGKVDLKDILAINKHRLGKAELAGGYLEAADVTGDNKVDLKDILQINKYRLGK